MKNKKLYKILTILVLVIIFSMALLYMGCKVHTEPRSHIGMSEQDIKDEAEAAEEAALLEETRKKAEEYEAAKEAEEAAAEEETLVEEIEVAEEEENLIPNEPITYSGSIDGPTIILIVNFKTTEVTGSISLSGEEYIDATISGKINIDNFEITSNYSGILGLKETSQEYPFNGTITGIITDDLSTFNGEILNDEGKGRKITASR